MCAEILEAKIKKKKSNYLPKITCIQKFNLPQKQNALCVRNLYLDFALKRVSGELESSSKKSEKKQITSKLVPTR